MSYPKLCQINTGVGAGMTFLLKAFLIGLACQSSDLPAEALSWHELEGSGVSVEGFYWYQDEKVFRRLPQKLTPQVYYLVDELAWNSAGGQLRFQTDSQIVKLAVELREVRNMNHMTLIGSSGFDLYAGFPHEERFVKAAGPDSNTKKFECQLFPFSDPPQRKMRSFIINFPLYTPVASIKLGLDAGAALLPPAPYDDPRPILIYGTSITQGCSASRPGMAPSNALSRRLKRPVLNFGFSSCGGGEPALIENLCRIENPALFVFDCEANAGASTAANVSACIKVLRRKYPELPILWVTGTPYSFEAYDRHRQEGGELRNDNWKAIRDAQIACVKALQAAGDKHLFLLDATPIWGPTYWDEATIDGAHPNDYGMALITEAWEKKIREILAEN